MYCLSQKHGEFMSFDNWYASFWSYKNKTVNLRFICVSMVISVVFAPLLHTLITWLHHKQVFFFHNNDFAPIKCNWNAALCTWLLLSDCCDNLLIIVLPTGPQAFVLVSVCRHKSAQNSNIMWATFLFPELPGLLSASTVPLIRQSTFGHHAQLNQTTRESRGAEWEWNRAASVSEEWREWCLCAHHFLLLCSPSYLSTHLLTQCLRPRRLVNTRFVSLPQVWLN